MFLHNLVTIKCMEHRPAITIENNPELQWLNVQISDFGNSLSILTFKITVRNSLGLKCKNFRTIENSATGKWTI